MDIEAILIYSGHYSGPIIDAIAIFILVTAPDEVVFPEQCFVVKKIIGKECECRQNRKSELLTFFQLCSRISGRIALVSFAT